jgi:hypothetical protein
LCDILMFARDPSSSVPEPPLTAGRLVLLFALQHTTIEQIPTRPGHILHTSRYIAQHASMVPDPLPFMV